MATHCRKKSSIFGITFQSGIAVDEPAAILQGMVKLVSRSDSYERNSKMKISFQVLKAVPVLGHRAQCTGAIVPMKIEYSIILHQFPAAGVCGKH